MPNFIPLNSGGDLSQSIIGGLVGLKIIDAFEVADNNSITGNLLRNLIGSDFDVFKTLPTMNAVVASATAMNAVVASATAMNAVAASATAMNAVAASATARNAIRNSSTAFNIVANSNMAIGKFVAGDAALNPTDYADMNAVAASATAMNAVAASATAMNAVVASATAMNAVCKFQIAAQAIYASIQTKRSTLLTTLADTSKFSKNSVNVGSGAGTYDYQINTNTICIPTACYDDGDTDYTVYYGADTSKSVVSIAKHNGTVSVTSGVSLRGVRVVGSASSVGYVTFDVYTAL